MGQNYTKVTITGTLHPYGEAASLDVWLASDATGPRRFGERWYQCSQCGLSHPRSETMFFKGKPFGIPCECYKDIRQLADESRRKG